MTDGTVKGLLDACVAERPDQDGAVFPEARESYRELYDSCAAMARRLVGLGVEPGDRVAVLLPGTLEHLQVLVGAWWIGAIAVPLNRRFKQRELRYVIGHSQARVVLIDEGMAQLIADSGPFDADIVQVGPGEAVAAAGDGVDAAQVERFAQGVSPEDPSTLLYTSGTTANPKGAILTHSCLVAEGRNIQGRLNLGPGDRFWTPLPLFHSGGICTSMGAFAAGATLVHVGDFKPDVAVDQLERERATHAFPAFESIWLGVLIHPRFADADLGALRVVINIGVPERLRAMQERLPTATQVSCFGGTESCGFLCMGDPADPLELRLTTSGKVMPNMELRAVDPVTGEDAAPGEPGEALYRGATRFSEYFRDAKATADAIDADGWFHSGDLIRISADGYVTFVGRLKDMLKVGGENVAAAEIEDLIAGHPAVEIVNVVSAPDARYTEVAAAYVELREGATATEQEIIEFCLGKIATFKVPRYVRFVSDWPMSGTKIQKYKLREQIARELQEAGITQAPKLSSNAAARSR
jgi:fatty-acyl-CoA synthase